MLHYLLPWMNNVELVDFKPLVRRQEEPEDEDNAREREMMVNSRRWLRGEGWGSPQATTMILNNLMFMTAKVHTHSSPVVTTPGFSMLTPPQGCHFSTDYTLKFVFCLCVFSIVSTENIGNTCVA